MKYLVIMPAYNESEYILQTLTSLVNQTLLPDQLLIIDDNSTDSTFSVAKSFIQDYPWINLIKKSSQAIHLPGSKVINAFNHGLNTIHDITKFDFIVKLDADLILPKEYFLSIANTFVEDQRIGMVGGFAYIEKNGQWSLENLTDKDHIRGAFKAYRTTCFQQIGGLKPAMGWDTVDELLCRYYQWEIKTLPQLKVKHLKPTGAMYDKAARYKQGQAFYQLHYGLTLSCIASAKLALRKKNPLLFFDYLVGYIKARKNKEPYLINEDQGQFIRNYRWKRIRAKFT